MKPQIMFVGNIVEDNGKTIRQNNEAIAHKFNVGDLVELKCNCSADGHVDKHKYYCGMRLFVASQSRDCDGSVGYYLSTSSTGKTFDLKVFSKMINDFMQASSRTAQDKYYELLFYPLENPKGDGLYGEDNLILVRKKEFSVGEEN